ncbi:HlyD family efflux transporter periplasmic adaptor subunit [Corynebacterium sp. HS2168-gen11]|uniref:HlyD family efflux transporter periplasmic adaptor subunit n=1 Tax=Corynebacterium sp. HS2168-gen11 TaxID=2974027 RepID=UPI00216AC49F|nr:efflux RND transporter periplasmic adaptor subunit [Corynebacterium sp. HS2168-gen11]MCS4535680.1 efflux RND transporter periplasmic adaptor subunit [Corynebacterium sp. HS2168-gen11]
MASASKTKKPAVIGGSILLAVALLGGGSFAYHSLQKPTLVASDLTTVQIRDNAERVSTTGTLNAAKSVAITTNLTVPVGHVNVKVGDRVVPEQLLATLNVETLERELGTIQVQQEGTTGAALSQVEGAQRAYDQYKRIVDEGLSPELNGAQATLRQAEARYEQLNREYELQRAQYAKGNTPELVAQDAALLQARTAMLTAALEAVRAGVGVVGTATNQAGDQAALDAAKQERDVLEAQLAATTDPAAQTDLERRLEAANKLVEAKEAALKHYLGNYAQGGVNGVGAAVGVGTAAQSLQVAQRTLESTLGQVDSRLVTAQKEVALAFDAKQDAATAYAAAQLKVEQQLTNQRAAIDDAVRSAQAAQRNAGANTQRLQLDIASAEVKAPFAGLVTHVNAKEGLPSTGPLLNIADDSRLLIHASLKEIDVARVQDGQEVEFTTPATGAKKYKGKVSFISPVASEDVATSLPVKVTGATPKAKTTFPVEIEVVGDKAGLRLGSTVKARIVVKPAAKHPVVKKEALSKETDGKQFALVIAQEGEQSVVVKREVKVEKLSDLDFALTGGEVKKGDKLLTNYEANEHLIGKSVNIPDTPAEESSAPKGETGTDAKVEKADGK